MLRIDDVSVSIMRGLRPVIGEIGRCDPDLVRQLRKCASSIALNLAEGSGSQGRNRKARYFNALGSAREVRACLHVALAFGYVETIDETLLDEIERAITTLVRLTV